MTERTQICMGIYSYEVLTKISAFKDEMDWGWLDNIIPQSCKYIGIADEFGEPPVFLRKPPHAISPRLALPKYVHRTSVGRGIWNIGMLLLTVEIKAKSTSCIGIFKSMPFLLMLSGKPEVDVWLYVYVCDKIRLHKDCCCRAESISRLL